MVLLLLVAAAGGWWVTRPGAPTLLGDRTVVGFVAAPAPLERAAGFAGLALPDFRVEDDEIVTFRDVPRVSFARNSAMAAARVAICVRDGEPYISGLLRDLEEACSQVRDIQAGTTLHWTPRMEEYLILIVTPTRPGVAALDTVTYDYERTNGEKGRDTASALYTLRAT